MKEKVDNNSKKNEMKCGLVMPISAIDNCNKQHWIDVKSIFIEAVESVGFSANLVSYADDVGIIQKRIIQNLYENPIIVCDVSGKNPNVMFELGLRLAFDKPTIIVKDDKTSYSFDTSPIEHLEYPRDLRFNKIVEFKEALAEKIEATYKKSQKDPSYTTFLKHFGKFTVAKLDTQEVTKEDFIIEEIKELKKEINRLNKMRSTHLIDIINKEDNDLLHKKALWKLLWERNINSECFIPYSKCKSDTELWLCNDSENFEKSSNRNDQNEIDNS